MPDAGRGVSTSGPVQESDPVREYLDAVADPQVRAALEHLREVVLATAPDAEPVTSYRLPAWRVAAAAPDGPGSRPDGRAAGARASAGGVVCGFAVTASGWSYYPFSGSVVAAFADRLAGWGSTKGAIHVPVTRPLPDDLVADMVTFRRREIGGRGR